MFCRSKCSISSIDPSLAGRRLVVDAHERLGRPGLARSDTVRRGRRAPKASFSSDKAQSPGPQLCDTSPHGGRRGAGNAGHRGKGTDLHLRLDRDSTAERPQVSRVKRRSKGKSRFAPPSKFQLWKYVGDDGPTHEYTHTHT